MAVFILCPGVMLLSGGTRQIQALLFLKPHVEMPHDDAWLWEGGQCEA